MLITVSHINIPAMSTIGYGKGTDEDGKEVCFVGDWRPMRNIGEAIVNSAVGCDVTTEVEVWQLGWNW